MALANARDLNAVAAELRKSAATIANLPSNPGVLRVIGQLGVSGMKDHFNQSKGPDGVTWPALKVRRGKPLLDTGRMRASGVATVQGSTVTLSNTAPFAGVHQGGKTIRAKKAQYMRFRVPGGYARKKSVRVPPRPHIGWSQETLAKVGRLLGDKVREAV
jgi:phage gpG-like protein